MNDWNMSEIAPSTSTEIANFADESMFIAQKATASTPRVTLMSAPNDPLGELAHLAKAYQGKFLPSYEDISDDDRAYYIQDLEKNILGMPSESIMFHFMILNVSRSFTHQLVRTRQASYSQESMRFAVKEDFPVKLPTHLHGTDDAHTRAEKFATLMGWLELGGISEKNYERALETVKNSATERERLRDRWDEKMEADREFYLDMVNSGMPAEDARDAVPHGILTNINMVINLRSLMQMAGQRLCTQAQWEHKMVWDGIIREIYNYGRKVSYRTREVPKAGVVYSEVGDHNGDLAYEASSEWQYELLAARFKPICYQTGRCQFRSDFDRFCNIRDRVEQNASVGRSSNEWETPYAEAQPDGRHLIKILPIHPTEWINPDAAIRPNGDWRSEEAKKNIAGRR